MVQVKHDDADYTEEVARDIDIYLENMSPNTQRTYKRVYRQWCEYLKEQGISVLRATELQASSYFRMRGDTDGIEPRGRGSKKISGNTLTTEYGALVSIYDMVARNYPIPTNPFRAFKLKVSKTRNNKRPTEAIHNTETVRELLTLPHHKTKEGIRDRAILAIFFGSGCRISEVVNLKICDVIIDKESGVSLFLSGTKNREDATQEVAEFAHGAIRKLIEQRLAEGGRPREPVFVAYFSEGPRSEKLSTSTVYRTFKYWCKVAGLSENISPHSARATVITTLLDSGVSHREIKEFSRHSSVLIVEKYDKRRATKENSAAKKLKF